LNILWLQLLSQSRRDDNGEKTGKELVLKIGNAQRQPPERESNKKTGTSID